MAVRSNMLAEPLSRAKQPLQYRGLRHERSRKPVVEWAGHSSAARGRAVEEGAVGEGRVARKKRKAPTAGTRLNVSPLSSQRGTCSERKPRRTRESPSQSATDMRPPP